MSTSLPYTPSNYRFCLSLLHRLRAVEDPEDPESKISITINSTSHLSCPELIQIIQSKDLSTYTYYHLAQDTHKVIGYADITNFMFDFAPMITSPATIELIHGDTPVELN